MYTGLATNIAKKFQDCEFGAKQVSSGVLVYLKRDLSVWRGITVSEVREVLDEHFTGNYECKKVAPNQVIIEEK